MSKQWIVSFDTIGIDTLVPWGDLREEDMVKKLAGEEIGANHRIVSRMILRAKANHQRFPEVWMYETSEDFEHKDMWEMWEAGPQGMADLVRSKGTNLFKHAKEKSVIV